MKFPYLSSFMLNIDFGLCAPPGERLRLEFWGRKEPWFGSLIFSGKGDSDARSPNSTTFSEGSNEPLALEYVLPTGEPDGWESKDPDFPLPWWTGNCACDSSRLLLSRKFVSWGVTALPLWRGDLTGAWFRPLDVKGLHRWWLCKIQTQNYFETMRQHATWTIQ